MPLELGLLVLESVLLVATVTLLVLSLREGRARDSLIMELSKAVRILTRHEYFLSVNDAMMDARDEVVACITGRLPAGEDRKRTREVVNHIERLAASGIKVKYLLPKFQDRLHIGWLYTRAGAEVRYSGCPLVLDFRYTVVNNRVVVIGIPEGIGEKEATRKGYHIPSEGLASILRKHFYDCWKDTVPYDEYLKETLSHTGVTPRVLAEELRIEESEFDRIAGK
jgi:hypothetical protein